MSHETTLYGCFHAGEYGVDEKYNQHHKSNRQVVENLPKKNASGKSSYYIHRGMFHIVDGENSFRSQIIVFGCTYSEEENFVGKWLKHFEGFILKLIGFGANVRIETELDGNHEYEWLIPEEEMDTILGDSPKPSRRWIRSGGRVLRPGNAV